MGLTFFTLTPAFTADCLKKRSHTNTNTTPFIPTSSSSLFRKVPEMLHWEGRKRPPFLWANKNPHVETQTSWFVWIQGTLQLLLVCSRWHRGRQNMFLIAKPNGYAWVLSCLWELVLPQPFLCSSLKQPCQNSVWEWSQGKHEALQGFGE